MARTKETARRSTGGNAPRKLKIRYPQTVSYDQKGDMIASPIYSTETWSPQAISAPKEKVPYSTPCYLSLQPSPLETSKQPNKKRKLNVSQNNTFMFFETLPFDIFVLIVLFLPVESILILTTLCKKFSSFINTSSWLWGQLSRYHFGANEAILNSMDTDHEDKNCIKKVQFINKLFITKHNLSGNHIDSNFIYSTPLTFNKFSVPIKRNKSYHFFDSSLYICKENKISKKSISKNEISSVWETATLPFLTQKPRTVKLTSFSKKHFSGIAMFGPTSNHVVAYGVFICCAETGNVLDRKFYNIKGQIISDIVNDEDFINLDDVLMIKFGSDYYFSSNNRFVVKISDNGAENSVVLNEEADSENTDFSQKIYTDGEYLFITREFITILKMDTLKVIGTFKFSDIIDQTLATKDQKYLYNIGSQEEEGFIESLIISENGLVFCCYSTWDETRFISCFKFDSQNGTVSPIWHKVKGHWGKMVFHKQTNTLIFVEEDNSFSTGVCFIDAKTGDIKMKTYISPESPKEVLCVKLLPPNLVYVNVKVNKYLLVVVLNVETGEALEHYGSECGTIDNRCNNIIIERSNAALSVIPSGARTNLSNLWIGCDK